MYIENQFQQRKHEKPTNYVTFSFDSYCNICSESKKNKIGSSSITSTLATFENLKAEIITEEGKQKLVIIIDNAGKKKKRKCHFKRVNY